MSDELAFSFLNKVKRNFFDCFFRIKKKGLPKSSKKKEIFSFFLSQQTNTHKKNHHRETLVDLLQKKRTNSTLCAACVCFLAQRHDSESLLLRVCVKERERE